MEKRIREKIRVCEEKEERREELVMRGKWRRRLMAISRNEDLRSGAEDK